MILFYFWSTKTLKFRSRFFVSLKSLNLNTSNALQSEQNLMKSKLYVCVVIFVTFTYSINLSFLTTIQSHKTTTAYRYLNRDRISSFSNLNTSISSADLSKRYTRWSIIWFFWVRASRILELSETIPWCSASIRVIALTACEI